MRKVIRLVGVTGMLLVSLVVMNAGASPVAKTDAGFIVIVFKDGHRQSIPLADIARMDFTAGSADASTTTVRPVGPIPSKNRFIGKWKVGDGNGSTFIIKLRDNGEATKSIGAAHGTWSYVDGEAHIAWDDGWHDAIRKAGTRYEKFAYAPGKSFSDQPANVTEASTTTPEPI